MNKGRLVLGIGFIVLSLAIFFVSSSADITFFDFGTKKANEVTTSKELPGVRTIKADGVVNMHISIGNTENVRYVFDQNEYSNKTTFKDGALILSFPSKKNGFKLFGTSHSGVDVYLTVDSLAYLEMNGVGSVKTDGILRANEMEIVNRGAGSMDIELEANKLLGRNFGVGSLRFIGRADISMLNNKGVGSLDADELKVKVLTARNQGVGSMQVYADEEIELHNSGVGSLKYSGDARVISSNSEGIGSISKK